MRILTTKKILVGAVAALTLVLAGCLTDNSTDSGPSITVQPTSQTKVVGDTVTMSVTATGTGTLSYKWVVLLAGSSTYDTLGETTSTIKFVADVEKDGGLIKCVVKDSKGTIVSTSAVLTVTGTAWPANTDTLTVGAQAASQGSVLDLDSGKVWGTVTANANLAKIDLVYLYLPNGGTDSVATLLGARAARDSGVKYNINLTNSYDTLLVKNIKLVKVTVKPSSQQHGQYAYENGAQVAAARIVAGDKFIVKTTSNKYVYVEVTGITNGKTGTSKVVLNLSTI